MTKYVKGKSGNPDGRPAGITDKRTLFKNMLNHHKNELLEKAVELALAGNEQMLRLLLDRLLPAKPKDDPIPATINVLGSLSEQAKEVIASIANGDLTPTEGENVLSAIKSQAAIMEIDELERRVIDLENIANNSK